MLSNDGKMGFKELTNWLTDVKGYKVGSESVTPTTFISLKIKSYNEQYPNKQTLFLGPEKKINNEKVKRFEYVEYRDPNIEDSLATVELQ